MKCAAIMCNNDVVCHGDNKKNSMKRHIFEFNEDISLISSYNQLNQALAIVLAVTWAIRGLTGGLVKPLFF